MEFFTFFAPLSADKNFWYIIFYGRWLVNQAKAIKALFRRHFWSNKQLCAFTT